MGRYEVWFAGQVWPVWKLARCAADAVAQAERENPSYGESVKCVALAASRNGLGPDAGWACRDGRGWIKRAVAGYVPVYLGDRAASLEVKLEDVLALSEDSTERLVRKGELL